MRLDSDRWCDEAPSSGATIGMAWTPERAGNWLSTASDDARVTHAARRWVAEAASAHRIMTRLRNDRYGARHHDYARTEMPEGEPGPPRRRRTKADVVMREEPRRFGDAPRSDSSWRRARIRTAAHRVPVPVPGGARPRAGTAGGDHARQPVTESPPFLAWDELDSTTTRAWVERDGVACDADRGLAVVVVRFTPHARARSWTTPPYDRRQLTMVCTVRCSSSSRANVRRGHRSRTDRRTGRAGA